MFSLFYIIYSYLIGIKIINFIVIFVVDLDEVSCGLEFSSDSNFSEYDVRSSPSTCQYMDSNLSDSSISLDYKVQFKLFYYSKRTVARTYLFTMIKSLDLFKFKV